MRRAMAAMALAAAMIGTGVAAQAAPYTIAVLGDSLTAGYGIDRQDAFPSQLERGLKQKGYDVLVINAGVSGSTAEDGLARVDDVIAANPRLVIVELGANDALRRLPPERTKAALDAILSRLKAKNIAILLTGMKVSGAGDSVYAAAFNAIYPELSAKYGAALYPFFLEGVARLPHMNLSDGVHPNARGAQELATRLLPMVESFVERARP